MAPPLSMATATCAGQLLSVELSGRAPGWTKANKLPVPAGAHVRWASGRTDMLQVRPLASGRDRDVFASDAAPYVLKLQGERRHAFSNAAEAALAQVRK